MLGVYCCEKCGTVFDTEVDEMLGPLETTCGECQQDEICEECGQWESDECEDCPCRP